MSTIASKSTGATGTLIIDDTSGYVSFQIRNTGGSTWVSGGKWSGKVNGSSVSGTYNLSGAETITVGKWRVTSSQSVSFSIAASGTSGLGGPTTVTGSVDRASEPGAPGKPSVSNIGETVADISWAAAASNGSAIVNYGLQVASDSAFSHIYYATDTGTSRSAKASGLKPAGKFYARVAARNGVGRGDWSSLTSFVTDAQAPDNVKTGTPTISTIPVSWGKADNGSQLTGFDVRYALSSDMSGATLKSFSASTLSTTLTGLLSGRVYWIQVRAKSSSGDVSGWTTAVSAQTVASVLVSNGSSWKPAEVLVSDGSSWKRAEVFVSDGSTWIVPG